MTAHIDMCLNILEKKSDAVCVKDSLSWPLLPLIKAIKGCSLLDGPWALHIHQENKEVQCVKEDICLYLWEIEKKCKKLEIQHLCKLANKSEPIMHHDFFLLGCFLW